MSKFKLTKPFYGPANGHSTPRHFKAGEVIVVGDEVPPAETWEPLDAPARAAIERFKRPFVVAPNGVQVIDRATGQTRVTRHNEKVPRADPLKPEKRPADLPKLKNNTPADYVAERREIFVGEGIDAAPADITTERLRDAIERGR